jgi:hypothetical protein
MGTLAAGEVAVPIAIARGGAAITIKTTSHGAERLAGAAATRGGVLSTTGVWATRQFGKRMAQSDGATVYLRQHLWGGRADFVVQNSAGRLITSGYNWPAKSIARMAKRYGWQ